MMENYRCPICQTSLRRLARYPTYVCGECISHAKCSQGRALEFLSDTTQGRFGYAARYRDDGSYYTSHECWIHGQGCRAEVAPFGGVVIQRLSIPTPSTLS